MPYFRVIPVLLLENGKLVKTQRFSNPRYVGDPINAVRIFNEKEVDEIVLLDISASRQSAGPSYETISDISSEAFMPMAYGGGINDIRQMERLINSGVEKIVLGCSAFFNPDLVVQAAGLLGSQSVVICIDVKKDWLGRYRVHVKNGSVNTGFSPLAFAQKAESLGAGEIILQSIDRDGSFSGYDEGLIRAVAEKISIPVVALGGAASVKDFSLAKSNGASAAAAGSLFVFQLPHRAVLISYPDKKSLEVL